ncbi:MAG: hypothetical protein ACQ9MH_07755 [Nitrospinales bacterium]
MKWVAVFLLGLIGLKSVVDVDKAWDVWSYHMPFAGLLWGMSSPETLFFDSDIQVRFEGFAIFGEWLQGFFWFITGHFEAGNLVGFLSLLLYLFFLKSQFNVPIYLSSISLLAVPLIQMHAVSSYVDLPGSLAVSVLIMMTYKIYSQPNEICRNDIYLLFLGASCAANIRLKLIPVVFFILLFTIPKLLLIYYQKRKEDTEKITNKYLPYSVLIVALAIIFATPIKNTLINGNPVYPVKIQIGDITLNHAEPIYGSPKMPGQKTPRFVIWLYSIFEFIPMALFFKYWVINAWWLWVGTRFGGYFGAYVLFHLIFFCGLLKTNWSRDTKILGIIFLLMTAISSLMPSSQQVRYYMFWLIVLISINLHLVFKYSKEGQKLKFLNIQTISLAACSALFIVVIFTKAVNVSPQFYSLDDFKSDYIKPKLLISLKKNEGTCVSRRQVPLFYLYSSALNPPLKYPVSYCYRF